MRHLRWLMLSLLVASCRVAASPAPPPEPRASVDAGVRAPRLPDPGRFAVWGIDVSHHQQAIDWKSVAREPRMRFAFIKATQGASHTDARFLDNWNAARAAGLRVGAYHYFSFCTGPEKQAAHFLAVVPRTRDALPPVLDVEHLLNCDFGSDPKRVRATLRVWLDRVEKAWHRKPIVYATSDVIAQYLTSDDFDYPLWVRCTPEDPEPVLDLPWRFLQYDDQHSVGGVGGDVDHDVFAGSEAAFAELVAPARAPRRASSRPR